MTTRREVGMASAEAAGWQALERAAWAVRTGQPVPELEAPETVFQREAAEAEAENAPG
jgi:hypothetical protein